MHCRISGQPLYEEILVLFIHVKVEEGFENIKTFNTTYCTLVKILRH